MNEDILANSLQYLGGEILSVLKESILARRKNGEYCNIPIPRFRHRQIVKTTSTYYSPKSFTRLINPTYTDSRGWVYGENYIDRNGSQGGSSYSWDESDFLPLDDARDILIAKRIELNDELSSLSSRIKQLSDELGKVDYAIKITTPTTK